MTEVVVERDWDAPLNEASIARMLEHASGCFALHRVHWNRTLLSPDGRESLCHFSSVDAESVRLALRTLGSTRGTVWACTLHDAPGFSDAELARANVLVSSRFEAPVPFDELTSLGDGAVCLANHRVRFVRTLLAADRQRMISLCQAPDAESVRIALREAKAPVERVWAFRQFRP